MAFLKNLRVDKVSFVGSPANKRKFLLLKSEEGVPSDTIQPEETIVVENQEEKVVASSNVAEVVVTNNLSEEQKPMPDENVDVLKAENAALLERVAKLEYAQNRTDLINWLTKNCPYLPDDVEKTADTILKLEKVDADAAKIMKETLQKSSIQLQTSKTFSEIGTATDITKDNIGGDIVTKVYTQLETLKKSDKGFRADDVANVIKSMGPEAYARYRNEFNLRARTN